MNKAYEPSPLGQPLAHESGYRHTSGQAMYVDDAAPLHGMLYAQALTSPHAHAKILSIDTTKARAIDGVYAVLTASDIPGTNDIAPVAHDEPLLAIDFVHCVGQSVALVVARDYATCRAARDAIDVVYEELPAILDIQSAIAADSFLTAPHVMTRGDVDGELARAFLQVSGEIETGGQDHFYLETQASTAIPEENGTFKIFSSTQHPSEVQAKAAEILGIRRSDVVVETPRMGGGFGGKETQAAHFAAFAALGALKTKRPVRVWLNRDQDMTQTGKRHPWYSRYEAGFDQDGRILALKVETYSNGGWSLDLSQAITDRCMFHLDNAYYLPTLRFMGRSARTNHLSNTAFRGFGGPQGMAVIEHVMNVAGERLGIDSAEIRKRNFYGSAPRNQTQYYQVVENNPLARIHSELLESSNYRARLDQIAAFNASSTWLKRGLAFGPVKFGISFTYSVLNQAGAFVNIYSDGSVHLNHGGTEMGQGLHTKMLAICAHELGVEIDHIRVMNTSTGKVPNTSATAASSGSDLNGQAVRIACQTLVERLKPTARRLLGIGAHDAVLFSGGLVRSDDRWVTFPEVIAAAYLDQVSLSATGYYRTPDINYDRNAGRGKPFHYFAYGGCVVEVEVHGLTGEHRLRRVDILHDVGDSLVPSVDRGQVEGGFIQGYGWLTTEELVFSDTGELRTHSPDTYKIPSFGDAPIEFNVRLLDRATTPNVIHGSKAVGEPPLMLALTGVTALRQAIRAFAPKPSEHEVELKIPCTPESVLWAVESIRRS